MSLPLETARPILDAVDALFDEQVAFLQELVKFESTRGHEQAAQDWMAAQMRERGLAVDQWDIDVADIENLPGFSPVQGNYEDAVNVVGAHRAPSAKGRSLILNGHVDVVPIGPLDMWAKAPFDPVIADGWMHGRGAGDMKAGLASNLYALDALRRCGWAPAADVFVQSVVEEECTGNGALACVARGYRADAALIPEPFDETLISAQVGVIWFQVRIQGLPTHVAYAGSGANAIEAAAPLMQALHGLQERWNHGEHRHAGFAHVHHPLNINVGKIAGGDWASSVPAWCTFDVRMGVYPGQPLDQARAEIEAAIHEAAQSGDFLRAHAPEVIYNGFMAEGYALMDDQREPARAAVRTLEAAHHQVTDSALSQSPTTATTDARVLALSADIPTLVYGPKAEAIHGFNERVDLESMRRVTQTTALFVAQWCGLQAYGR